MPKGTFMINVKDYGAKGDNGTDDTAAIQAAINAGPVVYFPPGQYRTKRLELAAGTTLLGANSGGYGVLLSDSLQSHLTLIAGTNDHMLHLAQCVAHARIRDLHLDGNKNNNTAGDLVHADDVATPEECQLRMERVYVDASAGYGIYIGNGRRAVKVQDSVINYSASAGIRINGSDALVRNCIIGSNTTDGIQAGASIARIVECDIYGNTQNGVNVLSTITQVIMENNGIDRNGLNGVYLGSGADQISIIANNFHSNSQATNGGAHHINIQTTTGGVAIFGNVFGTDSGITNAAGYGIYLNGAGVTVKAEGNVLDNTNAANLGLTNDFSRITTKADRASKWAPSGAQFFNLDRVNAIIGDQTGIITSGRLQLAGGMVLPMGTKLTTANKINVLSGNTAGASLTHLWFCVINQSGSVLVKTTDDTSGSWSGNAVKSLSLSSTYFVATDTPVYIGIVVVGTTMPSFRATNSSNVANGAGGGTGDLPVVAGYTTDASLTDPSTLGATIGAVTAVAQNPYCWIS